MKFSPLLLLTAFCFSSCGFVTNKQVVGKYHIIAIDVAEDACLAYETGDGNYVSLVAAEVISYCNDENNIYVKQRLNTKEDKSFFSYYIVPIVADTVAIYPEERIIGPLNELEFYKEISRISIEDLYFKNVN
ncbi:hypothetical protein ACLI1A_06305 [Flavobacterium sp. RHBU_3]|uniref:hypothetical protein n=1 Tax=Flavobacterium sp. RHBU_3 TaxID=3391184 RepID=UPI003985621A